MMLTSQLIPNNNMSETLLVLDQEGNPVANATISIHDSAFTTDSSGRVNIVGLQERSNYPFTISKNGFVPSKGSIIPVNASMTIHVDTSYSVGSTGPAGGLIAYDNPNAETDGWQYIEVAPSASDATTVRFSNVATAIGTTTSSIGSGPANTTAITSQSGFTSGAASLCTSTSTGTYTDWFLPSSQELNLLYDLHTQGKGGFTASSYWSSTETNASQAVRQTFNGGAVSSQTKTTAYRYRPIRRFSDIQFFKVCYLGNNNTEGTLPTENQYYPKGTEVVVSGGSGLMRGTDNFVGWNTQTDGLGTDFSVGSTITIGANTPLYAKYESSTLIFLPDTQSYVAWKPSVMEDQVDWVVTNQSRENIKFVGHVGDLIQNNDTESEWEFVQDQMNLIGDVVPYAIVPGNHDYTQGTRTSTMMNSYFPLSTFSSMDTYGGAYDGNCDNTYHIVNVHGTDWLILALEFGPRSAVVTWASGIISTHSSKPTIVMTHAYLKGQTPGTGNLLTHSDGHAASNGYGLGSGPPGVNDGDDLWPSLIYPNSNIRIVICGHDGTTEIGNAFRESEHADGSKVYQIMCNFQYWSSYPGYFVLLKFDSSKTVRFRTYSPTLQSYKTDTQSSIDLTLP